MSYTIYDSTGYKGDLASGGGLAALSDFANIMGNNVILKLLEEGYGDPEEVATAAGARSNNAALNYTLEGLQKLAKECKDIVIINNGIMEEGGD